MKEAKLLGKVAFKSNVDRFKVKEEEVPGPGNYPLPGAVHIRSGSMQHASFRSGVKKELFFPMDKDVPGPQAYNPTTDIGAMKITGGAPNNFTLLAKGNKRELSMRLNQ